MPRPTGPQIDVSLIGFLDDGLTSEQRRLLRVHLASSPEYAASAKARKRTIRLPKPAYGQDAAGEPMPDQLMQALLAPCGPRAH